jgi:hypothetical protein
MRMFPLASLLNVIQRNYFGIIHQLSYRFLGQEGNPSFAFEIVRDGLHGSIGVK